MAPLSQYLISTYPPPPFSKRLKSRSPFVSHPSLSYLQDHQVSSLPETNQIQSHVFSLRKTKKKKRAYSWYLSAFPFYLPVSLCSTHTGHVCMDYRERGKGGGGGGGNVHVIKTHQQTYKTLNSYLSRFIFRQSPPPPPPPLRPYSASPIPPRVITVNSH